MSRRDCASPSAASRHHAEAVEPDSTQGSDASEVDAWLAGHAGPIMEECRDALTRATGGDNHGLLLARILDSYRNSEHRLLRPAMTLPLAAAEAVRRDITKTDYRLTAALVLLETGIYLLDHVMDNEVDSHLQDIGSGALVLAAVSLISHVPGQTLVRLPGEADPLALIGMLNDGQAHMASGQLGDVSTSLDRPVESAAILDIVAQKTGERRSLYARMGTACAGAAPGRIESFGQFGCNIGIARQVGSDLFDLVSDEESRDLAAGIQTFPIAMFFEMATHAQRDEMRQHLAREKPAQRQGEVVRLLADSGAMRVVIGIVQDHCEKAMRIVPDLSTGNDARRLLAAIVDEAALFPLDGGEEEETKT